MFQTKSKLTFHVEQRFSKIWRFLYAVLCKNMGRPDRPDMTIRRMRIACWILNATDRLRTCNIIALALQQCLHEGASVLL
jgi:hypothetical protein